MPNIVKVDNHTQQQVSLLSPFPPRYRCGERLQQFYTRRMAFLCAMATAGAAAGGDGHQQCLFLIRGRRRLLFRQLMLRLLRRPGIDTHGQVLQRHTVHIVA